MINIAHYCYMIYLMLERCLLIVFVVCFTQSNSLPEQAPVIGVFAQQQDSDEPTAELRVSNLSYFAASYVKYLEMAGAQVVPVFGYQEKAYYDQLLPKINGVLFPGTVQISQVEDMISISEIDGLKMQTISSNIQLLSTIKEGCSQFGGPAQAISYCSI